MWVLHAEWHTSDKLMIVGSGPLAKIWRGHEESLFHYHAPEFRAVLLIEPISSP